MNQFEFVAFVDEAGDFGHPGTSPLYCMAALVVRNFEVSAFDQQLLELRQEWTATVGLPLVSEVHTGEWLINTREMDGLFHQQRVGMIKRCARLLRDSSAELVAVSVDKRNNRPEDFDPFTCSWELMLDGINAATGSRSCHLICDEGHDSRVRNLLADSTWNFQGGVDPNPEFVSSTGSYRIQAADLVASLCYQYLEPNPVVRRLGGRPLFALLSKTSDFPSILEK